MDVARKWPKLFLLRMALVANYSGESSSGEEEDEEVQQPNVVKATASPAQLNNTSNGKPGAEKEDEDVHISDEEDVLPSVLDEEVPEDMPGLSSRYEENMEGFVSCLVSRNFSSSSSVGLSAPTSSFTSALPPSASTSVKQNYLDANEDTSDLPLASAAERASAPVKPKPRLPTLGGAKKKRGGGPVRIVLPSLSGQEQEEDDDEDSPGAKRMRPSASEGKKKPSALLSMLPAPKQGVSTLGGGSEGASAGSSGAVGVRPAQSKAGAPAKMLVPDSVARRRAAEDKKRKELLAKAAASDEEDSDDESTPSFFSLETKSSHLPSAMAASSVPSSSSSSVTANPYAPNPLDRPLSFRDKEPMAVSAAPGPSAADDLAPAAGPSLPTRREAAFSYPEAEDLMANEEAINRMAGAHALRRKEEMQVVDVSGADLAADTREWLTKALTEDDADKPGPKNTIKGESRRKHQVRRRRMAV